MALFHHRNRPAWVVLLSCLFLTFAAWYGLHMQAIKSAGQQFELHVRDVVDSIEDRLRQQEQILLGGAGLFDASKSVNRTEWRTYVERLNLGKNYPGILGVGYSQLIQPADLQAHIAAVRAEEFPDYTVRPSGPRQRYTSIIYLEPFTGRNLAAFGYDMMSEATRATAMRMAAESGKTSITGKVRLVQETYGKEQAGFLMYVPVYRKHLPLTTPQEHWDALQGFVYSPYRVDDLMAGILGKQTPLLDFVIFDGESETSEARMYTSMEDKTAGTNSAPPKMSEARAIHAYGRIWTVHMYSRPEFEARFQSPLNTVILALGGGISVLLFFFMSFLISRREHAENMAERMTLDIRANEEKLRQSEARIQAIVEGAEHFIITTNTEGVIQSFNRSAEHHLGYTAEELIGKTTPAIFHESDEVVHRAQELTAAGIPVEPGFEVFVARARQITSGDTHEWSYIRKDGSHFPVSLTVSALRNADGEITSFLGIATDITERNLAIQARRDDEARLNEAQRIAKLGSWELNLLTDELIWSDEIFRLFEIDKEKFGATYEAFLNAIHPDDRDTVNQAYTNSLVTRLPYEITHRLCMSDGRTKWVQERCTSDFDAEGKVLRSRGTVQDITELRIAEYAAQESATRTQTILDNVLDGIITINELGTVESFNKSAERIFGYAAAEVIGNNVKMLMPEPYHTQHDGYLHNYVSTGVKKIIGIGREVLGRRKDGSTFPMDLAVSQMLLGGRRVFTGIVRDITERVKIERMKNEFVSTVSHELRTPLTSIRGSLGLLAGGVGGELPAQAKSLIDIAHKNSERLILLVNDILDMEKIESGKMEFKASPTELMPLLKQALEGNLAYAGQFKVTYELGSELPEVMVNVDANRLMQVLANLLSNAAKFSPPGGKVSIDVTSNEKRVRVAVSDHGSGIPDQFRDQIFQKFAQADSSDTRQKSGTGLGLSITKAIVEQMGGSIGFESQPNIVTTFFVEFPIWQEAAVVTSDLVDTDKRKRVLICEDDNDIAALLRLMLEQAGLAADIAYSATQAKQMLAQHNYAVMTLDLSLPDQEGIALIRELRAEQGTAALPIVVVSAKAVEGRKELNSEAFSVIDWISKPIIELYINHDNLF